MFPAEPTADIHTIGPDGLLLLAQPLAEHVSKTGDSWKLLKKENEKLEEKNTQLTSMPLRASQGVSCWLFILFIYFDKITSRSWHE